MSVLKSRNTVRKNWLSGNMWSCYGGCNYFDIQRHKIVFIINEDFAQPSDVLWNSHSARITISHLMRKTTPFKTIMKMAICALKMNFGALLHINSYFHSKCLNEVLFRITCEIVKQAESEFHKTSLVCAKPLFKHELWTRFYVLQSAKFYFCVTPLSRGGWKA